MDEKADRNPLKLGGSIFRGQVEGDVSCSHVNGGMSYSSEYVRDHSSLLSLQPWIFKKEACQNDADKLKVNSDISSKSDDGELSPANCFLGYRRWGGQNPLRTRRNRRYSTRSATSVKNCLIPQLYNEHFEIEEYALNSSPASIASNVRPLVITDGKRIISKSSYGSFAIAYESGLHKDVDGVSSELMDTVVGVPPLRQFKSPRPKSRDVQPSSSPRNCKFTHSQDADGKMLLFCLGINVGVISTMISSKSEIERLIRMLKHNENLVQDLQEELDMKMSVTVKELDNEASRELIDHAANVEDSIESLVVQLPPSIPAQKPEEFAQPHLSKSMQISEFRRIEAELEAELEMLEMNMNASSLEGRLSALGELDPDLVGDVVHGELKADMLNGSARGALDDSNRGTDTSSTETHDGNYAVSPRELSLRLHEVIQFRLEERIKELESELTQSQMQLEYMKAERIHEVESYSDTESPILSEQNSVMAQPLCLNLSGDALHAYDEAYVEFMQTAHSNTQETAITNSYEENLVKSDGCRNYNGECDNESDNVEFRSEILWENMLSRESSDDVCESDNSDDEEGKMLIQKIVERTKQGSPVLVHAQRMLMAMDE